MIKLSNLFNNINQFIERVKSSNLWNEDKTIILDILTKPYKIADVKYWKLLYNTVLDGFTKNSRGYVELFDYSENELNIINNHIENEPNRTNFIKLSINKILKSDEFQEFIKLMNKYNTSKLFSLTVKEEENFQTKYYTYIVNDEFEIAEFKSGSDSYLPNNGSRIRSVRKKATDLSYKTLNIRKLFNSLLGFDIDINKIDEIFKSDYHNVRWGYTGPSKPSKQSIIEKLQQIYYEYTK